MMGSMSSFVRAFMAEASHFEAPALAASANARHLVSRNKREGKYVGRRPNLCDRRHGYALPVRHRRQGSRP